MREATLSPKNAPTKACKNNDRVNEVNVVILPAVRLAANYAKRRKPKEREREMVDKEKQGGSPVTGNRSLTLHMENVCGRLKDGEEKL